MLEIKIHSFYRNIDLVSKKMSHAKLDTGLLLVGLALVYINCGSFFA